MNEILDRENPMFTWTRNSTISIAAKAVWGNGHGGFSWIFSNLFQSIPPVPPSPSYPSPFLWLWEFIYEPVFAGQFMFLDVEKEIWLKLNKML